MVISDELQEFFRRNQFYTKFKRIGKIFGVIGHKEISIYTNGEFEDKCIVRILCKQTPKIKDIVTLCYRAKTVEKNINVVFGDKLEHFWPL
jgi:hypothetical protein